MTMRPEQADQIIARMLWNIARSAQPWRRPKVDILRASLLQDDPEALAYVQEVLDPRTQAAARRELRRQAAEEAYEAQGLDLEQFVHLGPAALDQRARGQRVWLYHGTSSRFVRHILRAGLTVTGKQVDPRETPGVYLTAAPGRGMSTGGTAAFYAQRAAGWFGGEPVVLRVLVDYNTLSWDSDDEDIETGGYQWVTDYVPPSGICEVGGRRVRGRCQV